MAGWFDHFFLDSAQHGELIHGTHDSGLVMLSLFVSIFSATMALYYAQLIRSTRRNTYRRMMLGMGALALGGGVWCMDMIGMMALRLPVYVSYTVQPLLFSFCCACLAAWLALRTLVRQRVTGKQFVVNGVLVGAGISMMHYSGMVAMQMPLLVRYDAARFALSLVVFAGLAIFSLWVRYRLRRVHVARFRFTRFQRLLIGGGAMGGAIAAMHHVGMIGVRFIDVTDSAERGLPRDVSYQAIGLFFVCVIVSVMAAALSALIRSRELYGAVEEGRSRLRAMLDTAVDGIITIDSRGLIYDVNQSAQRLFGWSAEELIGRNVKLLMPDPDQSAHDGYLRNYLETGVAKIIGKGREVMGMRKDGSVFPMRLAVGRVDLPRELFFVGFVSDISERRALEDSLRAAVERAEQAASAKSNFLANMSHEIRTPMNAIIGFAELLLQTELTTQQRHHLSIVSRSSRSLLRLLDDILDTTKIEKGRMELDLVDFSLKSLAVQLESSLCLSAQTKDLSLTTTYPDDMPEYFRGDPLRVLQVLSNLVGNAIKFTEQGGVEVVFSYEREQVHVQVRDTGIGMTPQQLEDIFVAFVQADPSISSRFGGTGLGTTIARQLTELMGGRIHAESQFGQGSTFHVWLPLSLGQEADGQRVASGGPVPQLPPLRVLIADDVPQNLELLSAALTEAGHQVVMANDGAEAVDIVLGEEFDVVLMDVHMPGVDGLQATRRIRQNERESGRPYTPVIALTASVMADDQRAARQAGMDGFTVKPLDFRRLFDEISRVLKLTAIKREMTRKLPNPIVVPHAGMRPVLQKLYDVLARREWDGDLLENVCAALSQAGLTEQAETLRLEADAFEFDQAQELLKNLIDGLERSPAE